MPPSCHMKSLRPPTVGSTSGVANDDPWRRFCAVAGTPELADDTRFASAPNRVCHRDVLVPLLKVAIKQRPRDEWLARFYAAGVPCWAIRSVDQVCESEVLRARSMIAEMQHGSAGTVKGIKSGQS
jgi:crotonobetainyl-CoA:carnitine CoA-transferase CaiB-like acyl-CoA transferase